VGFPVNFYPPSLNTLCKMYDHFVIEITPQVHSQLIVLCSHYRVARLELTGSAARSDFEPSRSDIDLLVEFAPDAQLSALTFIEFSSQLEKLLERRVDLIELSAIQNPILREALARDRQPFYAAA